MRRLFVTALVLGAAVAATTTTGAQQAPTLTCSPTSVPANGGGVWVTCSIENFPPQTQVLVKEPFAPSLRSLTTDDAGRTIFTFVIPEASVCTQRSGLTVAASGGGTEASFTIGVTPVPLPPAYCGFTGAVQAQPRSTG